MFDVPQLFAVLCRYVTKILLNLNVSMIAGNMSHGVPAKSYQFDDDELNQIKSSGISCDRLRQALKKCLKESPCVQQQARSAKECIDTHDGSVPDKCFALLTNFTDCKKSLVDMRSRFRGRKGDI